MSDVTCCRCWREDLWDHGKQEEHRDIPKILTCRLQIRLGAAAGSDEIASTRQWRVAFQLVVEQSSLSLYGLEKKVSEERDACTTVHDACNLGLIIVHTFIHVYGGF